MIERLKLQRRLDARFRKRINRAPSPVLAYLMPWASTMAASLVTSWLAIADRPALPPFGYLVLLGWRQLHPGLLPVWAGLPLGLFDDLVSGQPVGSGVLLWSTSMIALEAIEARWPWRNFAIEWAVAAVMIVAALFAGGVIASGYDMARWGGPVMIQAVVSVLVYPLVGRLVAWLDRVRLVPLRKLD